MDYIGSKLKLNSWIFDKIQLVFPKTEWNNLVFLDACAGSGTVSKFAIENRFEVISNDLFSFSSIIVSGFSGMSTSFIDKARMHIKEINKNEGEKGFFFNNYSESSGKKYFSDQNAMLIDSARKYIDKLSEPYRSYLLYCGLEAMCRVMNTTGVQAAYLKKLKKRALGAFTVKEESYAYSEKVKTHNQNILFLLKNSINNINIIYIDPPYTGRQYGPNYHLYETFVRNDNPELSGKTGLRPWQKESKSDFCNKERAYKLLSNLISLSRGSLFLLSYSSDGIMFRERMEKIISGYTDEFGIFIKKQRRYKADNSRKNNEQVLNEFLFFIDMTDQ